MKVYFDKTILIERSRYSNDSYTIYSPYNSRLIEVNKLGKDFISHIVNNQGYIDYEILTKYIKNQHGKQYSEEQLNNQINELINAGILSSEEIIFNHEIDSELSMNLKVAYLHPTLNCNYNCDYCYNKNINIYNVELSTSQWINIIDKLKRSGITHFVFTGGEVLLRNDLLEILTASKDENTNFQIITNGSLLKRKYKEIIDLLDIINISLDSFDITVAKQSRSDKNFNEILTTLEELKCYSEKIIIKTVVTKYNLNTISNFKSELENQYGFKVSLTPFNPNNLTEVSEIPKININNLKDSSSTILPKKKLLKIYRNKCGACRKIIAIGPNGDIYPCQSLLNKKFKISNIFNEDWEHEVKNSKITDSFAKLDVDKKKICKDCSYRYLCGGGCPASGYKLYGDLKSVLTEFCEMNKELAMEEIYKLSFSE